MWKKAMKVEREKERAKVSVKNGQHICLDQKPTTTRPKITPGKFCVPVTSFFLRLKSKKWPLVGADEERSSNSGETK